MYNISCYRCIGVIIVDRIVLENFFKIYIYNLRFLYMVRKVNWIKIIWNDLNVY